MPNPTDNPPSLKGKTASGLLWGGLSQGAQQLLNLVFGIFLARLLSQSDYGMVGLLTVFSTLAAALQEGGFISALANKKEVTHSDYNAVFWFSTLCSLTFYVLLFLLAPLIARFYGIPELTPLARLLFLGFVVASMASAPRAYLFRNLMVRQTTIISLTALIVSGVAGIVLAANGFAYWGLAMQSILFVAVVTALNFHFARFRPTLPIDLRPLRGLIGFSSRMVVTNVFNIINQNLFAMVLGKLYSPTQVGNFTQANKWNSMGHATVTSMLQGVAQPVLAQVADDRSRQLAVFRKLLRFTAFVSFPALFGLSIISEELIVLTITERWLDSARILRLLCIWGAFAPITGLFSQLVISRGRSSVYMWSTIALALVQLTAAIVSSPWGLEWMLRVFVAVHVGWLFVWFAFAHREVGMRLLDLLRDLAPYLLLSLILTAGAYLLASPIESRLLSLLVKVAVVAGLYALILWRLDSVIFRETVDYLLRRKRP